MAEIVSSSNNTNASQLIPGQRLKPQESISSPDGSVEFWMQRDGKVAVYHGSKCVWQNTPQQRNDAAYCTMDGVLKIITNSGQEAWASDGPSGQYNFLAVQDDGNVVIYSPVWATSSNK